MEPPHSWVKEALANIQLTNIEPVYANGIDASSNLQDSMWVRITLELGDKKKVIPLKRNPNESYTFLVEEAILSMIRKGPLTLSPGERHCLGDKVRSFHDRIWAKVKKPSRTMYEKFEKNRRKLIRLEAEEKLTKFLSVNYKKLDKMSVLRAWKNVEDKETISAVLEC